MTWRPASPIRSSRPKPRWRSVARHYRTFCAPCHGPEGKGGTTGPVAVKFIPTPDLTNAELQKQRDRRLLAQLHRGRRRGDAGLRRGPLFAGGLGHRELPPHAGATMTALLGDRGGDRGAGLRHDVGLAAGLVDLPGQPRVLVGALAITGPAVAGMMQLTEARWSPTVRRLAITTIGFLPIAFVLLVLLFAGPSHALSVGDDAGAGEGRLAERAVLLRPHAGAGRRAVPAVLRVRRAPCCAIPFPPTTRRERVPPQSAGDPGALPVAGHRLAVGLRPRSWPSTRSGTAGCSAATSRSARSTRRSACSRSSPSAPTRGGWPRCRRPPCRTWPSCSSRCRSCGCTSSGRSTS